jgi:hypothetical protein
MNGADSNHPGKETFFSFVLNMAVPITGSEKQSRHIMERR